MQTRNIPLYLCFSLSLTVLGTAPTVGGVPGATVVSSRPPPIRVVYFVPADREPLPNRVERLDRTLEEVRRFYRDGMAAAGYGPLTFELERDKRGRLVLHEVRGRHPTAAYGRNDASKVREEVRAALAARGIDADRELLLIVQVLLRWENGRAIEVGPYVGSGNGRYGTAYVYDDERLDAALLGSRDPGGWYNDRPCSIGRFNTHYIGGIAHELGHAFGLPHDSETESDRRIRGRSLMGSGNHTYGEERRGEGLGTFLSAISAMQLRYARPFAGHLPEADTKPVAEFRKVGVAFNNGKLVISGIVTGSPPVWGLAAWNDPSWIPNDYDAVGWTTQVMPNGRFALEIGELKPGRYELRLGTIHTNGRSTIMRLRYHVDGEGTPDLVSIMGTMRLVHAMNARAHGDYKTARRIAKDLIVESPSDHVVHRKAEHLLRLLNPPPIGPSPAEVPASERMAVLSRLSFKGATVGWARVMRDEVPEETFIEIGNEFFPDGLWAHAKALYRFDLGGRWRRFRAWYGLHDISRGSVVFVIRGDKRELFRSEVVRDHRARPVEVDVRGVRQLELIVEDAGDGITSDWGIWGEPVLER